MLAVPQAAFADPTAEIVPEAICGNDGATLSFNISTSGDSDDLLNVLIDGQLFNANPIAAGTPVSGAVDVEDGLHELEVTDLSGIRIESVTQLITCDGPIVFLEVECETGELSVALWYLDDTTFDLWIDGELIDAAVPSVYDGSMSSLGQLTPGDHAVAVFYLDDAGDGPYFSETITVGPCPADSGAGIPDTGSETTPLLIGATVLTLGGIALHGTRRLRRA